MTNALISWEFIPSPIYISDQIETYLPYFNINQPIAPILISSQSTQAINSFIAFILILLVSFLMKNEIIAMLLFVLLFLFGLIFPNNFSIGLSSFGLIIVLLYMIWKFGKGES
jgi:hypothetical protein